MKRDLTSGNALRNIIYFSLPYLLAYFLQTLYGLADLYVIGKFGDVAGTTAVSNGSQIMHMVTVMIVGLAMGSTVMIGRSVGERRPDKSAKCIGNTILVFMVVAICATIVLAFLVHPIIKVMSIPAEAVDGTAKYLLICFLGIPFITAYNIIAAVFRGLGDSKTPMIFVAVACAVNIGLDFLFMGALNMGPSGAAFGTILAQAFSVVFALLVIRKRKSDIKLSKSDLRPDKETVAPMLKIGLPIMVQDGIVQIGFLVITIIVNMRGVNDAAAVGIVEKFITLVFLVPSSMLSSVSAISSQNVGAGNHQRASLTLRYGIMLTTIFGLIVSVVVQFAAGPIVGLFTKDATVVVMGSQYLRSYIWDSVFAGVHFCFSGYFVAYGRSGISFLHNLLSIIVIRIPVAYFASKMFLDTLYPMGWSAPSGSALSAVICLIAFLILKRKGTLHKVQ